MNREIGLAVALGLALASLPGSVAAHHPPHFERCQMLTIAGRVERIQWASPHVQLSIAADDGAAYEFLWESPRKLNLAHVDKDTMKVGDRVIVMGTMQKEGPPMQMLLSDIKRPSDGWQWMQLPQGC